MVLKLYGIYRSPWVRLVAAILILWTKKQVQFELVSVNYADREHKTPEFLEKHPFGQIPYTVCDFLIVAEFRLTSIYLVLGRWRFHPLKSKAICYYIASKYANQGTPLLPTGVEANALYQQAVFVELNHYHGNTTTTACLLEWKNTAESDLFHSKRCQHTHLSRVRRFIVYVGLYGFFSFFFFFILSGDKAYLPTKTLLTSTLPTWAANWMCTTRLWANKSTSLKM